MDQDLWDSVQEHLKSASARRRGAPAGQGAGAEAPLKGEVRDETGDILTPTHTLRRGKRQRYYVSNRLISGGVDPTGWRLPARPFETVVIKAIADHLSPQAKCHAVLSDDDITKSEAATKAVLKLASGLETEGCIWGNLQASEVQSGDMAHAITLARYYLSEASRLSNAANVSTEIDKAETLRQWLLGAWSHSEITPREVVRLGPNSLRESPKAKAALAILEEHGWLVPLELGTVVRGTPRAKAWRIVRSGDIMK